MPLFTTPKKSLATNEKRLAVTPSPSSRRSLEFDYWNVSPQVNDEEGVKRRKKEGSEIMEIKDLKTGVYFDESIQFRVTMKKIYNTETSSGIKRTLKFNGVDKTGEIAFVAFEGEAEKFGEIIQMNECYKLSSLQVIEESKNYPNYLDHKFNVRLTPSTMIEKIDADLPEVPFKQVPLNEISCFDKGEKIDVVGIAAVNWGLQGFDTKKRRYITIVDEHGQTRVTLWNQAAEEFGDEEKIPVLIRKAEVDEYNGIKCLNTAYFTGIWKNPAIKCDELVSWFKEEDKKRAEKLQAQNSE